MIKYILWDIDGTLLDFKAAQKVAIHNGFKKFNLGICTEEMLHDYDGINHRYWQALERGEITKPEVLTGRFKEFFGKYGLDTSCIDAFNAEYQVRLGDTCVFFPNAYETVEKLKKLGIRQYAVTNGTKTAQDRKLEKTGLIHLFDGVYISDVIGHEKPTKEFFEPFLKMIGNTPLDEVMIVGDSLTSDIKGGCNIGILTCFYNPAHITNDKGVRIDYEITDLAEVLNIIEKR